MIDYEAKFWLPFKGVDQAGLRDPRQSRLVRRARSVSGDVPRARRRARGRCARRAEADLRAHEHDRRRASTSLIAEAARLRERIPACPTGFQRAPFFEIQTDRFALLALDTGIVKRIDDGAVGVAGGGARRARGKLIMAMLGHPFYAGRYDMASGNERFRAAQAAARRARRRPIVMAGDTHDLEYYAEPRQPPVWHAGASTTSSTAEAGRT